MNQTVQPPASPIQPRPVQAPQPRPVNAPSASPGLSAPPQPVLRSVDGVKEPFRAEKGKFMKKKSNPIVWVLLALVVMSAGVGSGYALALVQSGEPVALPGTSNANLQREVTTEEIKVGTKVGIADEKTFKDSTEGELAKGGIDGEGSHQLKRPGGDSQTVYITSSVIDLDQFVGRKVKVWGETMSAAKAGWLMDVGKLEVME